MTLLPHAIDLHPRASVSNGGPRKASHKCPECGGDVWLTGPRPVFCSKACRKASHYREVLRGRQLLNLAMAARATRDGSRGDRETGAYAAREARSLMQQWADEDRAAGRMSAVELVALRRRMGHVR